MTELIILAAFCLGSLGGYVMGCERVHRVRRQRNIAWRHEAELRHELSVTRALLFKRQAS